MREPNTELRVEISNPVSQDGESWVEVRVIDGPSGESLAGFRMDPARWYRLLHGGSERTPGFVSRNLQRVGKRMENTRASVDESMRWRRDATPEEIIDAMQIPAGWEDYETASVRRTNAGPEVVLRRWVDDVHG